MQNYEATLCDATIIEFSKRLSDALFVYEIIFGLVFLLAGFVLGHFLSDRNYYKARWHWLLDWKKESKDNE